LASRVSSAAICFSAALGLAAAGGPDQGEVAGLVAARDRDRADLQSPLASQVRKLRNRFSRADHAGATEHPVGQRFLALDMHGALDQPDDQNANHDPHQGAEQQGYDDGLERIGKQRIAGNIVG
jgi:hypothetical protein